MKIKKISVAFFSVAFFFIINSSVHSSDGTNSDAIRQTESGAVKGICFEGSGTCSWRAIPYAVPPVGQLRFKPPQDPKPWEGMRDAAVFGYPCCQKTTQAAINPLKVGALMGREDCLTLNIWRPRGNEKLPVMVWIHGGTLLTGSGSFPIYDGKRLAKERKMVVVTINYRLGPMGFLAHQKLSAEDPNKTSGNYGHLDQIKALEWVKRNIANFGGDPDNVTIFGESAGGWSVCALTASPLAKGLFNKAIMESGGCDEIITMDNGYKYGDQLVKDLGCRKGEDLECLRETSVERIFDRIPWDESGGTSPFKTHIDGWFMPDKPMNLIKKGEYNRVPFIAGSNRDEMKPLTYLDRKSKKMKRAEVENKFKQKFGADAAQKLLALYPFDDQSHPIASYFAALGDSRLGCTAYRAAEAMAATNNQIYLYRFDYDETRFPKVGAFHGLEIPFIFNSFDKKPMKYLFKKENLPIAFSLAETMRKYWTIFASTGNPNGESLPNWPVFNKETKQFIIFDTQISTDSFKPDGRCAFWEEYWDKK